MPLVFHYYVYTIISLKNFDIYTDITTDLKTRIQEHMRGLVSSSKIRIPFKLVHYEYFINLEDAKKRENYLKSNLGRAQLKDSLIKTLRELKNMPYRMFK